MSYIKNQHIDKNYFSNIKNDNISNLSDVIDILSESLSEPSLFYELELAEVLDVINNSDHSDFNGTNLGYIKVRMLQSQYNDEYSFVYCKPFYFGNILTIPLLNELIYVAKLNNPNFFDDNTLIENYYWLSGFKFDNNIFKNLAINYSLKNNKEDIDYNDEELMKKYSDEDENKLQNFNLGDTIFVGRFHQSLLFSYNTENYEPYSEFKTNSNKLIQTTSPTELDMVSDIKNSKYKDLDYDSRDVQVLESDINVIQSKKRTIISADEDVNISSNKNTHIQSKSNIIIDSKKIFLGDKSTEPIVLGDKLIEALSQIIDEISNIKVICSPPGNSSSPIMNIAQVQLLKTKMRKILSKSIYVK